MARDAEPAEPAETVPEPGEKKKKKGKSKIDGDASSWKQDKKDGAASTWRQAKAAEMKQRKAEEMKAWRKQVKAEIKQAKLEIKSKKGQKDTHETGSCKGDRHEILKAGKRAEPETVQEVVPAGPKKKKKQAPNQHSTAEAAEVAFKDPEAFKVCVAGIPLNVNEALLRKDFSECGEVLNVRLLREKENGKSRGIAFISFADQAALDSALSFNGTDYGGRSLWVKVAEKGKAVKVTGPGEKPSGCTSVILKGLAYSVTEDDLTDTFKNCGNGPSNVSILCDRETGTSRGIAFVDFDDEDAVDRAIKLNGSELKGRRFSMDYATPRKKTSGPGEKPAGCTSVLVKGLPYSVTDAELMKVFRKCDGGPTNVRIVKDKSTGTSRGMAFVDFDTESAVEAAIKLHGTELQGRRCIVEYAKAMPPGDEESAGGAKDKAKKGPGKKPAGCTSVTAKGLAEAVTEKTLMKLFKACGEGPRNVNIVFDKETGAPTGTAFVNFSSEEAVDAAMELNGTVVKGQSISMGYVKPKNHRK
eukprot:TRINITY_DN27429_c0_g1_i1.p1 TRINITY_DN27429_c0_g1~~TRINITY_DN27429_c0_g1_i1.p1  ORF type:complete len:528 (-),score=94.07 TRINITY_DN27429_c0_g1_i1:135-1718(-)